MSDTPHTNNPTPAEVAQAREPNHLLAAVGLGILINALIPASWLALRIIYLIAAAATVFMVHSAGAGAPEKQSRFARISRTIMTRLTKNPNQWWTVFAMFAAIWSGCSQPILGLAKPCAQGQTQAVHLR